MLINNALYHFLQSKITTHTGNPSGILEKVNKQNKPYLLVKLDKLELEPLIADKYHRNEHHISIFATQSGKNKFLSNYHYTSTFTDDGGENYRLHVYFDEHDQIQGDPVFENISQTEVVRIDLADKEKDYFYKMALGSTNRIISDFRSQHQTALSQLRSEYKALNKCLEELSQNFDDNKSGYLTKLAEMQACVKSLINYTYDNSVYSAKRRLFAFINKQINKPVASIIESEAKPVEEIQKNAPTEPQKSLTEPAKKKRKRKKKKAQKIDKAEFFAKIDASEAGCKSVEQLELTKKVGAHIELRNDIYYAVNVLNKTQCTLPEAMRLHELCEQSDIACFALFKQALVEEQYELASNFSDHTNSIAINFLSTGMQQLNAGLVDFILSNSDLAVNTTTINDGKGETLLPVQYLYQGFEDQFKDDKESEVDYTKYIDVLKVLLKHGASLSSPARDGLSIMRHLLNNPKHPLLAALCESNVAELKLVAGAYKSMGAFWGASLEQVFADPEVVRKLEQIEFNKATSNTPLSKNSDREQKHQRALAGKRHLNSVHHFINADALARLPNSSLAAKKRMVLRALEKGLELSSIDAKLNTATQNLRTAKGQKNRNKFNRQIQTLSLRRKELQKSSAQNLESDNSISQATREKLAAKIIERGKCLIDSHIEISGKFNKAYCINQLKLGLSEDEIRKNIQEMNDQMAAAINEPNIKFLDENLRVKLVTGMSENNAIEETLSEHFQPLEDACALARKQLIEGSYGEPPFFAIVSGLRCSFWSAVSTMSTWNFGIAKYFNPTQQTEGEVEAEHPQDSHSPRP